MILVLCGIISSNWVIKWKFIIEMKSVSNVKKCSLQILWWVRVLEVRGQNTIISKSNFDLFLYQAAMGKIVGVTEVKQSW